MSNVVQSNVAQSQVTELRVSFREWISLKDAEDCLEKLGVKNYYLVPHGDEVILVVTVLSEERLEWERKICAQPEIDTVQMVMTHIVPVKCLQVECKGFLEYTGKKRGKFFVLQCSVCKRKYRD